MKPNKKDIGIIFSSAPILVSIPDLAENGVVQKTPKRGQFCPKGARGHQHTGPKCTSYGARARWEWRKPR